MIVWICMSVSVTQKTPLPLILTIFPDSSQLASWMPPTKSSWTSEHHKSRCLKGSPASSEHTKRVQTSIRLPTDTLGACSKHWLCLWLSHQEAVRGMLAFAKCRAEGRGAFVPICSPSQARLAHLLHRWKQAETPAGGLPGKHWTPNHTSWIPLSLSCSVWNGDIQVSAEIKSQFFLPSCESTLPHAALCKSHLVFGFHLQAWIPCLLKIKTAAHFPELSKQTWMWPQQGLQWQHPLLTSPFLWSPSRTPAKTVPKELLSLNYPCSSSSHHCTGVNSQSRHLSCLLLDFRVCLQLIRECFLAMLSFWWNTLHVKSLWLRSG